MEKYKYDENEWIFRLSSEKSNYSHYYPLVFAYALANYIIINPQKTNEDLEEMIYQLVMRVQEGKSVEIDDFIYIMPYADKDGFQVIDRVSAHTPFEMNSQKRIKAFKLSLDHIFPTTETMFNTFNKLRELRSLDDWTEVYQNELLEIMPKIELEY